MKILVAGGFDSKDAEQKERIRSFSEALGSAIAEHDHVLLNGCRTEFDGFVAEAAHGKLAQMGKTDPHKWVISYILAGSRPSHGFGNILKSRLTDWDIAKESFYISEQVQQADVVILVGGYEGTFRAANWARIAGKPVLAFTGFGGAAAKIDLVERLRNSMRRSSATSSRNTPGWSSGSSTNNSTASKTMTGTPMLRTFWRWPRRSPNRARCS